MILVIFRFAREERKQSLTVETGTRTHAGTCPSTSADAQTVAASGAAVEAGVVGRKVCCRWAWPPGGRTEAGPVQPSLKLLSSRLQLSPR